MRDAPDFSLVERTGGADRRCCLRTHLEGIGIDRLTSDLWPLAVTAVLTLSIGGWVFNRRLG